MHCNAWSERKGYIIVLIERTIALLYCDVSGAGSFLCVLAIVSLASSVKDAEVDNMIGDSNDEAVLKAMKDSGVVSDMEQKLSGGRGLLSEERTMLLSFIEEYKVDNKKEVSSKHVMDIVEKVVSNRKPNLPQILVQLGPVMDVLSKLEKGTKRIDIIIGQFSEVLESDKSTKEIFHLFKKFLDKEVLKQSIHDHPKEPKRKNKAPSPSTGLLDTLLQEFFKVILTQLFAMRA